LELLLPPPVVLPPPLLPELLLPELLLPESLDDDDGAAGVELSLLVDAAGVDVELSDDFASPLGFDDE
jgi:hypothetical protein